MAKVVYISKIENAAGQKSSEDGWFRDWIRCLNETFQKALFHL
jgi:hypothetical protein